MYGVTPILFFPPDRAAKIVSEKSIFVHRVCPRCGAIENSTRVHHERSEVEL